MTFWIFLVVVKLEERGEVSHGLPGHRMWILWRCLKLLFYLLQIAVVCFSEIIIAEVTRNFGHGVNVFGAHMF